MEYTLTEYQRGLFENNVTNTWSVKIGEKTTVVVIKLINGFEITGTSGCVNPADYVFEIGEHFALVNALGKLDEYIGFMRQQDFFEQEQVVRMLEEEEKKKRNDVVASGTAKLIFGGELANPEPTNKLPDGINITVNTANDAEEITKAILKAIQSMGRMN